VAIWKIRLLSVTCTRSWILPWGFGTRCDLRMQGRRFRIFVEFSSWSSSRFFFGESCDLPGIIFSYSIFVSFCSSFLFRHRGYNRRMSPTTSHSVYFRECKYCKASIFPLSQLPLRSSVSMLVTSSCVPCRNAKSGYTSSR
jgi:hypothetical protein